MTPHDPELKERVGVRELHDRLSRYVSYVAEGAEVVITSRGRPVARLVGVDEVDPLELLRRRGLVQEPTGNWKPRPISQRPGPSESVADLVSDQRR